MEKMLDKKSRDFAKNMRDTMIYDKSKNEVQIGTNLYVDGKIKQGASNHLKINCNDYPAGEITIPADFTGFIEIINLPREHNIIIHTGKKLVFPPHASLVSEITSYFNEVDNVIGLKAFDPTQQLCNAYSNVDERFLYVTDYVIFIGFTINY